MLLKDYHSLNLKKTRNKFNLCIFIVLLKKTFEFTKERIVRTHLLMGKRIVNEAEYRNSQTKLKLTDIQYVPQKVSL